MSGCPICGDSFVEVFMRRIASIDSGWTERQIQLAYVLIGVTTLVIVLAGATAILPFLTGSNPIEVLLPLSALYVGYWGIGMTIAAIAAAALQADRIEGDDEETIQQVLLSAWDSNEEVEEVEEVEH